MHFETDDIVILIAYYFFYSSHVDIWFFVGIVIEAIIEIPSLDLTFHLSILLLNIPNPSLKRAVLLFDLIDLALEFVVLVPDEVLCCHVAIEVDAGLEDVVIGVDLLAEMVFVLDAFV